MQQALAGDSNESGDTEVSGGDGENNSSNDDNSSASTNNDGAGETGSDSSEDDGSNDDNGSEDKGSEANDSDGENNSSEDQEYDLELDENSPLTQEELDEVAAIASERGLNKEQAQALIKERESFLNKGYNAAAALIQQRLDADAKQLNEDPMFSGESRAENFAHMSKAVKHFDDADGNLTKAVNDPYIGNNVHLAKFLVAVGKALGSENIEGQGPLKQPTETGETARLKRAYPQFFKENS